MKLTEQQVRHVANLARLALTPEEEARFATRLSVVLDSVETLSQVDTTGVVPTSWVVNVAPVVRSDEPAAMLTPDEVLDNAPQKVDSSFAIPRVIE